MGKNYDSELQLVGDTAAWASALDLSAASEGVSKLQSRDLVVVASGGSAAAAQLLAQLHISRNGRLATVMTPLEFIAENHHIDTAACFISAGGSNNDILKAWGAASARGIDEVALLCGNSSSPLATRAREARVQASIVFDVPTGPDGFLATNSLVAFCCLILRLYGVSPPSLTHRPAALADDELLERATLVVLYGGWLKMVAIDLESRFTEAALGCVQIADLRNFAHGRHHWLAKRGSDTAVLALISPQFSGLARDTLAAIPPEVTIERWEFNDESPAISLLGLHRSLELAKSAAARLGYDAGRPGVPEFGHRIYDLKTTSEPEAATATQLAVARKLRAFGARSNNDQVGFLQALTQFKNSLRAASLAGIVLDYDGTIVSTARRFEAIENAMVAELNRLLGEGLLIGVATGRGKSVHKTLRAAIAPAHWSRCWVGYYNGGAIRTLAETCDSLLDEPRDPVISQAEAALQSAPELVGAMIDVRPQQITATRRDCDEHGLWMKVRGALDRAGLHALKVLHSSHSVDVVPPQVSKTTVVHQLCAAARVPESEILKIGDRGRWPGNDADLLAMSHGLSVDQISGDPNSCWNITPAGLVGALATVHHLRRVRAGRYAPDVDPRESGNG